MRIYQAKALLIFALLLSSLAVHAQTKNIFLDRSFWSGTPSVADINAKIAEGHNPTAKSGNGFDGVTYAILQNAPLESISYMVSLDGNSPNKITHDGRNYIFWAAYKDNLPAMKMLVDEGSQIDMIDSHQNTPLTFAAGAGVINTEIYDFLIENGSNVHHRQERGADALLLIASYDKGFKMSQYFIKKGLDLYVTDDEGNSAFNYAAKTGNIEMMDILIERDVAYKTLNKVGGNAMFFAAMGTRNASNPLSVYTYLESKGVQANVTTDEGKTPLHILAAKSKDLDVFNFFLNHGVDLNQIDDEGNNALMIAANKNDFKIVELLGNGTDNVNVENKDGQTALNNAVKGNTTSVIRYLSTKGAVSNNLTGEALIASVNGDDLSEFKMKLKVLKSIGFNPAEIGHGGNTMLHYAAATDNVSLVTLLISEGVDINVKNDEGYSALMVAAMQSKNIEVMKYLVSQGADKNVKTDFEETAFDLANENELLTENAEELNFLRQ